MALQAKRVKESEKVWKGQLKTQKRELDKGSLSLKELMQAEVEIIKFCQRRSFQEELAALRMGSMVKRSSHLHKLSPVLQDGVLRVGGRLSRSAMPAQADNPAILPKNHHVTQLIIRQIHENTGHSGRNYTLSHLRQQYWVPSASAAIRKLVAKCVVCRRLSGSRGEQHMADLPAD